MSAPRYVLTPRALPATVPGPAWLGIVVVGAPRGCACTLGCACDCPNAPWNFDLPRTSRLGYLRRFVRWLHASGLPLPLPWRPAIWWLP